MNTKRFATLKATVAFDLSADQCVELEALVGEIASARLSRTNKIRALLS